MKKISDIEVLYETITEDPKDYQEIIRDEDAKDSMERWPLISSLSPLIRADHPILAREKIVATEIDQALIANISIPIVEQLRANVPTKTIRALDIEITRSNASAPQSIQSLFERLNRS